MKNPSYQTRAIAKHKAAALNKNTIELRRLKEYEISFGWIGDKL